MKICCFEVARKGTRCQAFDKGKLALVFLSRELGESTYPANVYRSVFFVIRLQSMWNQVVFSCGALRMLY